MKIVIANWKMKYGVKESLAFLREFKKQKLSAGVETVLVPSFTALSEVKKALGKNATKLGAQDVFWRDTGAFTGEISPLMLKELGVSCVIIGHSERRQWLKETDATVNAKILNLLKNHLMPIMCVGETWQERNKNLTGKVISRQLRGGLKGVTLNGQSIAVAYEPVWAIGTGRPAAPQDAGEVHRLIRRDLEKILGPRVASNNVRIIYGGSVNAQNAASFATEPAVDGFLVGGASLDPKEFVKIIKACE
ncbi:MAG: triose-phosphate isomerase [Thermodesulfovibrionia bacterium]|nr:triose-phosphate isomerase [Thermodesulfovibrionia bacterium]